MKKRRVHFPRPGDGAADAPGESGAGAAAAGGGEGIQVFICVLEQGRISEGDFYGGQDIFVTPVGWIKSKLKE